MLYRESWVDALQRKLGEAAVKGQPFNTNNNNNNKISIKLNNCKRSMNVN